jgi:hypothetical protein
MTVNVCVADWPSRLAWTVTCSSVSMFPALNVPDASIVALPETMLHAGDAGELLPSE